MEDKPICLNTKKEYAFSNVNIQGSFKITPFLQIYKFILTENNRMSMSRNQNEYMYPFVIFKKGPRPGRTSPEVYIFCSSSLHTVFLPLSKE